ncbi:MAG: hypothetical protein ACE14M_13120 [Terriglobales bacterium]
MVAHRTHSVLALVLLLAVSAVAWQRRDPLTSAETDQLRETAQEPAKRLKLYLKFIGQRVAAVDKLRADPRLAGESASQIHDLLGDITSLTDELDDNIDNYAQRQADLRKPLLEVIAAETEFRQKLNALAQATRDPAFAAEQKTYSFTLETATDALNSSLDHARKTLAEQETLFKERKQKKK